MKHNAIRLLGLLLTGWVVSGCATGQFTELNRVPPDAAIAVAKFTIRYKDQDVTKGSTIIFNAPAFGSPTYSYVLDETGCVYAKLPVGVNSINFVVHKGGLIQHHFRSGEITCQCRGEGVLNYIGDITMDWQGSKTLGKVGVAVASHAAEAQVQFRKKYPTDRTLTPSLLVVNPNPKLVVVSPDP